MEYLGLANGQKIRIDPENYEILRKRTTWYLDKDGYVVTKKRIKGKLSHIRLQRFLTNCPKGMEVDHKNGDKLDYRKENLRICTVGQNKQNRKKFLRQGKASSMYKGVTFEKYRGWRTSINQMHIGSFSTEHQAALAYDLWARDMQGEFAQLNFKPAI